MHGHDPHYPMAEQTDEDHDIGLADAADGGVHVEMPPAEEELPQVVCEKVYRRHGDKNPLVVSGIIGATMATSRLYAIANSMTHRAKKEQLHGRTQIGMAACGG